LVFEGPDNHAPAIKDYHDCGHGRMNRAWLLPGLSAGSDAGLLVMRLLAGSFLIFQSQDNVFSAERMQVFVDFCRAAGIPWPAFGAPLSVWCQFLAGIALVLGLGTRLAGLSLVPNFLVGFWFVHAAGPVPGWWPPLALVGMGLVFATIGAGRFSVDAAMDKTG
jgi:putative oxidoreductase